MPFTLSSHHTWMERPAGLSINERIFPLQFLVQCVQVSCHISNKVLWTYEDMINPLLSKPFSLKKKIFKALIWRSNSVTLNKFPQSSHLAVVKWTKSPLSRFNIFQITNKLAMVSGTIKKKIELQSIPPLHHSMNLTTKSATQILCWMMQWKAGTFFQSWMHPWNLFFHVLQVCHLWKWSQLFHF